MTFIGAAFRLSCMTNPDNVDLDTPIAYRPLSDLERAYVDLGRAMDAHARVTGVMLREFFGTATVEAYDATGHQMHAAYGALAVTVAKAAGGNSSALLDEVAK